MLLIIQIFLWLLLWLAECSIKYSFQPHEENAFFGGKRKFAGWQKLRKGTKGLHQKVWTKTLSLNLCYFVAIYALFGRLSARKVLFWVKKSISWARSLQLHGTKTFVAIFALLLTYTTLLICMPSYRLVGVFHWQITVKDTSEQISDLKNMLRCD